jgi:Fur family ferric uptake transcriptional regulator
MPSRPITPRHRWQEYVALKGLRLTRQRELVVAEFLQCRGHLSINELLVRVRRKSPRLGYVTVYRTLKLLEAAGLAVGRQFGDGQTRFELGEGAFGRHHDHLVCTECGRIVEFENPEIERLQEEVARKLGFEVVSHKLEIYGRCLRGAGCRSSRRKPRLRRGNQLAPRSRGR